MIRGHMFTESMLARECVDLLMKGFDVLAERGFGELEVFHVRDIVTGKDFYLECNKNGQSVWLAGMFCDGKSLKMLSGSVDIILKKLELEVQQWLRVCGRYKKERVIRKLYRMGIFTQKTLPDMVSVSVANEDIEMYNKVAEVWNDIFGFRPLSVDIAGEQLMR